MSCDHPQRRAASLHPSIAALVAGLGLRLPIIATDAGHVRDCRARSRPPAAGSRRRRRRKDRHRAGADGSLRRSCRICLAQLAIPIPTVTTPQMFTYQLAESGEGRTRKRIVLPEGDDDRILQAAGRLLQPGGGRPDDPRRRRPDPFPGCRTRRRSGGGDGAESEDQRSVWTIRRAVRRDSQAQGHDR